MNDVINPGYLAAEQAAAYVGMKPRNLAVWRKAGIIKFVKAGKRYFYRREWVEETMNRFIGYDISNVESIKAAKADIAHKERIFRESYIVQARGEAETE